MQSGCWRSSPQVGLGGRGGGEFWPGCPYHVALSLYSPQDSPPMRFQRYGWVGLPFTPPKDLTVAHTYIGLKDVPAEMVLMSLNDHVVLFRRFESFCHNLSLHNW